MERGTGARIMTVMTDGTTPAVGPRLCRYKKKTNSSAIAERPQSALVSAKSGRLGLCSTTLTMTESACKAIEFGEKKRKIRAVTPFNVIQGQRSRNQSKARMRLPITD